LDAAIRFGAQELRIHAISPKMMGRQLEGDKVVVLVFTTLWERSGASFSLFLQLLLFSSLLVFFSNEGCPRFSSLHLLVSRWGPDILFPHMQYWKQPISKIIILETTLSHNFNG
jgi:hypothetical protein